MSLDALYRAAAEKHRKFLARNPLVVLQVNANYACSGATLNP
jgi:hypothetical protein